jgi:hypothetical protein
MVSGEGRPASLYPHWENAAFLTRRDLGFSGTRRRDLAERIAQVSRMDCAGEQNQKAAGVTSTGGFPYSHARPGNAFAATITARVTGINSPQIYQTKPRQVK